MECLFDGCDNFVRYLNNKKWIEESDDKNETIKKAFQWAIFIEAMHAKLEAEDKLDEFILQYSDWREVMALPKLKFAGFAAACDELLDHILVDNISDKEVVETALNEYLNQCGEERTSKFLRKFSTECLLLKLFATFIASETNYEDAETQGRLCKAVWYEIMISLVTEEATRNEEKWKEHIKQLMQTKSGVESLIFLTIMKDLHIKKVQPLVIDRFQENLVTENVPADGKIGQFWQNFVRSDSTLLTLMFQNYNDFFEEFFEFFLKFTNDFEFNEAEKAWSANSWLTFEDVVRIVCLLTTSEDQNLSSYCVHIIDSMGDTPFWQTVKSQIKDTK